MQDKCVCYSVCRYGHIILLPGICCFSAASVWGVYNTDAPMPLHTHTHTHAHTRHTHSQIYSCPSWNIWAPQMAAASGEWWCVALTVRVHLCPEIARKTQSLCNTCFGSYVTVSRDHTKRSRSNGGARGEMDREYRKSLSQSWSIVYVTRSLQCDAM